MKKMILMIGLVIGLASFTSEVMAQPPHAKAWGKRNKEWDNKHWDKDHWNNAWEHKYYKKPHGKAKIVRPVVVRYPYRRPVRNGVVISGRARF